VRRMRLCVCQVTNIRLLAVAPERNIGARHMSQANDEIADRIDRAVVRYIKLGPKGAWEAAALEGGRLEWGDDSDPHAEAVVQDWSAARDKYRLTKANNGSASIALGELQDFYGRGSDTLWITFAQGQMWWGFADAPVVVRATLEPGLARCYRRMAEGWSNLDLTGRPLSMHGLSTALTKVSAYRRTICSVEAADYLRRRIKGLADPAVARALAVKAELTASVTDLVKQLRWADFELLVDLIFARTGWRRVSSLGGTMKDIDLLIEQPATGERASVQVKSAASADTFQASVAAFAASDISTRFFFVCHSPGGSLEPPEIAGRDVHLWTQGTIARLALDNGLTDWLIERTA
jgi:hypothetical protein